MTLTKQNKPLKEDWHKQYETFFLENGGILGYSSTLKFFEKIIYKAKSQIVEQIREYRDGWVKDDGFGNPIFAPEYQVIDDVIKLLEK